MVRFDVMVFLVSAVLYHGDQVGEGGDDAKAARLSQMLWDLTFEGFEESLRDRGVTDVRMASRMRKLLQNATGRRNAYLEAWAEGEDPGPLRCAVARNVLNGADSDDPRIDLLLTDLQGFVRSVFFSEAAPVEAGT